jgi:hypothetical protein
MQEDDVILSDGQIYDILRKFQIPILYRFCPFAKDEIWNSKQLVYEKIRDILGMCNEVPQAGFKQSLYEGIDTSGPSLVMNFLSHSVGFLKWKRDDGLAVNKFVPLPHPASDFLICGSGLVRVSTEQTVSMFRDGDLEISADRVSHPEKVIYTASHMLVRATDGNWKLTRHAYFKRLHGDVLSDLAEFNEAIGGADIVHACTTDREVAVLLDGGMLVIYDWVDDVVDVPPFKLPAHICSIVADVAEDGCTESFWLKGEGNRSWHRFDMNEGYLVNANVDALDCVEIIPCFSKRVVLAIAPSGRQLVYCYRTGDKLDDCVMSDLPPVKMASYVPKIDKVVTVDDGGRILVNSFSPSHTLEPCGAYPSLSPVQYMIAGNEELVLANAEGFQYVSFRNLWDDGEDGF